MKLNKKQKIRLYEIIFTILLLLFNCVIYPLVLKHYSIMIVKGNIYYYIQLTIFLITYLIIGGRIIFKSIKNIINGRLFDEFFLMSLATIVALILNDFFEGVAVMLFYQIGELFQSLAIEKSRKSITSLLNIAPNYANVILGEGIIKRIDVNEVNVDDIILVKVGEKIPVDGVVVEGNSSLDTSSLTGESLPVAIDKNDEVMSGSINLSGVIKIKATKKYEDSSVYKILTLIEEASESKGKTEQFITKFAKIYTPIVVILAFLLAVIPPLFDNYNFPMWIKRSLSFLVISCPCALVVSIPLAFFSGIGKASKKGILIKGGICFENLYKTKTFFFDKTGTLTSGKFNVIQEVNLVDDIHFKSLFKSIETSSNHPISQAISTYYQNEELLYLTSLNEIPGKGMKAIYNDEIILCGNEKLLNEYKINCPSINGTVIYLAKNNLCLGYVILMDDIKNDTINTISKLKKSGINNVIMLTGDKEEAAKNVSQIIGLDNYYSSLLPEEKLQIVKNFKENNKNEKIAFVGDGINDAPTLATVDVSFAMGKNGSSLAIESADIVLMDDNLEKVYLAKRYAKQTMITSYLNIIFSLSVKVICMILGVLGIGGMLLAIFADVGVMILCVFNSLCNYYTK